MIKKTEMDLMHQNVYIKTHKGEQIIEAHDSLKLQGKPLKLFGLAFVFLVEYIYLYQKFPFH